MKVDRKKLLKALNTVKPGLASSAMIEQSTSFVFQGGAVVTYNDEISVSAAVEDLELEGAINAKEFHNFLTKIKTDEIDIEVNGNEILLKAGRSKAGFILQTEIVLPVDEIGEIERWTSLPSDFLEGIKFVMNACSRDMSRPVLTCVHVNKNMLEGTDSFKIATFELSKKVRLPAFLLPANTCTKLVRMQPVQVASGKGWVHFKTEEDAVISCRTFEEKYVDVAKHIKSEAGQEIDFPKELLEIMDRADVFAHRDNVLEEFVAIHIEKNKLVLKSESDVGWFDEKARIKYTGEPIDFSVVPSLLKDILKQSTTGFLDNNKLIFIGDNWKYLTVLKA